MLRRMRGSFAREPRTPPGRGCSPPVSAHFSSPGVRLAASGYSYTIVAAADFSAGGSSWLRGGRYWLGHFFLRFLTSGAPRPRRRPPPKNGGGCLSYWARQPALVEQLLQLFRPSLRLWYVSLHRRLRRRPRAGNHVTAGGVGWTQETENDRFKKSFGSWFWGSMIAGTVLHFMLFQF